MEPVLSHITHLSRETQVPLKSDYSMTEQHQMMHVNCSFQCELLVRLLPYYSQLSGMAHSWQNEKLDDGSPKAREAGQAECLKWINLVGESEYTIIFPCLTTYHQEDFVQDATTPICLHGDAQWHVFSKLLFNLIFI